MFPIKGMPPAPKKANPLSNESGKRKPDWMLPFLKRVGELHPALSPLPADVKHILALRKNAAVLLLVAGLLLGVLLDRVLFCCCRPARRDVKKD